MFYIQLPDGQFINQPFHSINECRSYCVRHNIHGYQFLDEYQIEELRNQNQQPDTRPQRFNNSIIKRHFEPRERNMRVPVQPYRQQCAPNHTRRYESFKPKWVGRKRRDK